MKRWVLVTGSAKRIGRAIALELARAGWDIVVHYHTSQKEAVQTAEDIKALGRKACLAELDLANLPAVERLIPALAAEYGPLGALINNASPFFPDGKSPAEAHHIVNVEAARIVSENFQKQVSDKIGGVIINLLDVCPSTPNFSQYSASKIALREMTLDMAARFAPVVRVNGVALGPVLPAPRQSTKHFQKLIERTPLGVPISPEAVASAVRFLAESTTITGAIIPVDGGLHLKD